MRHLDHRRKTRIIAALLPLAAMLACAGHRPALPTTSPEALGLSPAGLARIAPAMQAYVDSGKLGGIYAVIVRDGRIGYERTFGWRDVERRDRLERDDVFRIFSMTKPIVAAGAMILIDQGKLKLDDPVAKYIPGFANIRVFAGGSATAPIVRAPDSAMTIRHLLTHTNGLGYALTREPADSIFARAQMYRANSTLAQFADSVAKLPLLFSPGSRWSYSSALEIVGRVIEVASGQSLDVFLDEQLFQPLGMRSTVFRYRPDLNRRLVTLYSQDTNGGLSEVTGGLMEMYEPQATFLWASGGLLSTPDDYMRFAQMLLNGGELNGVRVLSAESVHEMTRNQLSPELAAQARDAMLNDGYGFGLAGAVLLEPPEKTLGAPGIYRWSGYVGTYFWIDPRNRLLGMVWTQFSPGRAYPLEQEFERLVYESLLQPAN